MASYRPDITTNCDAVLKIACICLTYAERERLQQLLGEFSGTNQIGPLGTNKVADLATAAGAMVAITDFATALNSNSWHVD
jgi:hypothetical protein